MWTSNKAYDAVNYAYSSTEEILLDTNIWLFLFPPPSNAADRRIGQYTRVFAKLLQAKSSLVLDPVVLGEYLNAYFRIEHQATWAATYPQFKHFRQSSDFQSVSAPAVANVQDILRLSTLCCTDLATVQLPDMLHHTQAGELDFNDAQLIKSCNQNGWKLLTDDGDMELGGIEVLTANQRLLKKCP